MPDSIVPIDRIKTEAHQAARQYIDINDACRYPFSSAAAAIFRVEFTAERNRMLMPPQPTLPAEPTP